jgi:tRNA(Leu) C34 or U34 (ribose-2'-O)-methylase TrmL
MKFPAVVLVNPKYSHNLAAAIRACSCFGVNELLYTGSRMGLKFGERLPREERMKGYKSVEWKRNDFPLSGRGTPVCVEVMENSAPLTTFEHPEDAIYVFGPEDGGVPKAFRLNCFQFVHIPAHHCLNLAAAVNVVLAHRFMQRMKEPIPLDELLHETRGEIMVSGWEGE